MFATRDQENLIHTRQTAAAAKARAQTSISHPTKTPGPKAPKTPFKSRLNDENAAEHGAGTGFKKGGKAQDGKQQLAAKSGAFNTPADARPRAPLGMKTTNAKATKVFQTPGPLTIRESHEKTQRMVTSPRLRRPKLRVHQSDTLDPDNEPDREIERMPPRAKPLPDYPFDEFGPDKEYPQFLPENMMKGWADEYLNPVDADGISRLERKWQDDLAADDRYLEECGRKHAEKTFQELDQLAKAMFPSESTNEKSRLGSDRGERSARSMRPTARSVSAVDSVRAKSASTTLGMARQPRSIVSRAPENVPVTGRKTKSASIPVAGSSSRHAVATAAARSTLGYSQGRAASAHLRRPAPRTAVDAVHAGRTPSSHKAAGAKTTAVDQGSEEADLRKLLGLDRSDGSDDQEALEKVFGMDVQVQDEDDDFVFTILDHSGAEG